MRWATISVAAWSSNTCSATRPITCRGLPSGCNNPLLKRERRDECRAEPHDYPGEGQMGFRQVPRRHLEPGGGTRIGPLRSGQDGQRGHPRFFRLRGLPPAALCFPGQRRGIRCRLARIRAAGVKHYANFRRERPGEINHLYGGRGVYFDDPNGHLLELITRPYGPTPEGG